MTRDESKNTALILTYKNILPVIAEVRILHRAVRFLAAWDKLYAVDNFLASGQHSGRKEVTTALALLNGSLKPEFEELRRRAAQCRETLNEWESGDWLLAQKFMGVTTSYKYDPDGTLSVKMDGEMDNVRLLDQLATVREVDLYKNWAPFCDTSALLKRIDIVEMLVHFNTAFPGASRDCILHVYGCDAVSEAGCILIQGRSVDDWEGVTIPQIKGWGHARMDVRALKVKIEVLSPTSACTSIVANIDPKAPLPRPLVNIFLRRVAGMFLYYLREAAKRIPVDESNCHRERILQDEEFYKNWLVPRIERFYREKGWALTDVLEADRTDHRERASEQDFQPSNAAVTGVVSGGSCCVPSRIKACLSPSNRISRNKLRLRMRWGKSSRRRKETEAPQAQVSPLDTGIDPRLLEKWQARREAMTVGQKSKSKTTISLGLLASLLVAMCKAFLRWFCFSDEKEAYRFRALAALVFAAGVVLFCTLM